MKKFYCILFSILIMFSATIPSYASAPNHQKQTIINSKFGYSYSSFIDCYGREFRTFINDSVQSLELNSHHSINNLNSISYQRIYSILSDLGVDHDVINSYSKEELDMLKNCLSIKSIISYSKEDENGAVTLVSEDTALRESNLINEDIYSTTGANAANYNGSYKDSYMKITFVVYYLGNGIYKYTITAEWLTMPSNRGFDSIGACAMGNTVENNTRKGWYSYNKTQTMSGVTKTNTVKENFSSSDLSNAIQGNWYGSAALLNLPDDINTTDPHYQPYIITNKNYKAYYEYQGRMQLPKSEQYFNTAATYDHSTIIIHFAPSISITSKNLKAVIGISSNVASTTRTVEFDESIHYVPEI